MSDEPRGSLRVSHVWRDEVMADRVLPIARGPVPTAARFAGAVGSLALGAAVLLAGLLMGHRAPDSGVTGALLDLVPLVGLASLGFGGYYVSAVGGARRRAAEAATVTVGDAKGATFTTPDVGAPPGFAMFRLGSRGYVLTLGSGMTGTLCLGGTELEVEDFLASGGGERAEGAAGRFRATPVGPGDWGVIRIDRAGHHTIFFQFVDDERLPHGRSEDWELLAPALVFSLVLHATLLGVMLTMPYRGNAFMFPGRDAIMNEYLIQRPVPVQFDKAEPAAGTEDGEPEAPPASSAGESGTVGGEGDKPRKRDPAPDLGAPEDPVVDKVRDTGLLRHADTFERVAKRGGFDERLGKAMARMTGPANDGGPGGSGRGRGTGVGEGLGTGTTRGGSGKGVGGGGTAHADVVTQGAIETGGQRPSRGSPTGRGVKQVTVSVDLGTPGGDLDGLTKEQIEKVVQSRRSALRACYERQLQRNPKLGGKLSVRWLILPDGAVDWVKIKSSTLRDGTVEDCIIRQIQRMRFPKARNDSRSDVTYPFIFQQS